MAVIALTAVTAIIGVTVGAVTVHSLQTTNGVAGSVEARAAATAGIAEVERLLRDQDDAGVDKCPAGDLGDPVIVTGGAEGAPEYSVEVFADNADSEGQLIAGCPSVTSTRVMLVATGFADRGTPGAGATGGQVTMEAIYQYVPQMTEIESIDPAVYAYQIQGTLRNFTLGIEPNTVIASDIQIRTGNFVCTNGASVSGSVVLANGHAELSSCSVAGTLHVSDYIQIDSKRNGFATSVAENAIAAGRVLDSSGRAMYLTSEAVVGGDAFAGGPVQFRASPGGTRVGGNVTAARNNTTSVTVVNNTRVDGNVLSSGPVSASAANVGGTRSAGVAALTPPPAPLVPDWVNLPFTSDPAAIQASTWWERGFRNVVTWSGPCVLSGSDPRWSALNSYTERTIVDATACTTPIDMRSNLSPTVSLRTDVVFFAESFVMNSLPLQASNAVDARRVYFVVPDNNPNPEPTCNAPGDIYYNNEANINAPLALFFYTPCKVLSDRNNMRGQIYGGSVEFRQQAQWTFVPSTPPGVDFTAGADSEPVQTGALLGERLTLREITSGG